MDRDLPMVTADLADVDVVDEVVRISWVPQTIETFETMHLDFLARVMVATETTIAETTADLPAVVVAVDSTRIETMDAIAAAVVVAVVRIRLLAEVAVILVVVVAVTRTCVESVL